MQEKKRKKNSEKRKVGGKAQKQENRTQGVSIETNLPVSATKPRRGPFHIICHLLPAFVGNCIKYLTKVIPDGLETKHVTG